MTTKNTNIFIIVLLITLLSLSVYFAYKKITLEKDLNLLSEENNYISQALSNSKNQIRLLQNDIILSEEAYDSLRRDYRKERKQNAFFQKQIHELADTVFYMDKLADIDEELLKKYSRVFFLSENYIPATLKKIKEDYVVAKQHPQFFHGDALTFLERMIRHARRADIELKVLSAYRSFDEQKQIKNTFLQIYGEGANEFSADQGFSEHQLGTSVDFTDPETVGLYQSFENTKSFAWLEKNAHKYGFILSYPKGNEFYIFEPWHWRFVGRYLSDHLHDEELRFYEMSQREIDKFLIKIFD